jgi:hypothetical protein
MQRAAELATAWHNTLALALARLFASPPTRATKAIPRRARGRGRPHAAKALSSHIPAYVLEHAPFVHLYSEEEYWPGAMAVHVEHTEPHVNYTPVRDGELARPDLRNLDRLNSLRPETYLQSRDDPETYPYWLSGQENVPEGESLADAAAAAARRFGAEGVRHRSSAPAVLVVVEKGNYVDAFWFYFYSFNLGNQVLGVRFGNHVGDWEHTAIRFRDGTPIEVFFSEHEWGAAYRWEDCERHGKRVRSLVNIHSKAN